MIATVQSPPLIGRFVPDGAIARPATLLMLAIAGSLALWASAKVSVPFWPVPMTLQTGVVALIGATYGWRLGLATVLLYLAEGAAGLPVFQGTPQQGLGLGYMIGPTGGFLLGFAASAAIIGWLAERGFDRDPLRLFGAMLAGTAVVFLLGVAWLSWFAILPSGATGIGFAKAFSAGAMPFILGDIVKLALAACLISAGRGLVRP